MTRIHRLAVLCFVTLSLSAPALAAEPTKAPQTETSKVVRIVFVGQMDACPCTLERIDTTKAALDEALKPWPNIPVERLYLDADAEALKPYRAMKAIMVAPAIYLLDARGELVDMLQGELTKAQIEAALK